MEWNALPGQRKQRNYQLWEMRTGHIENCIRLLEHRIQESQLTISACEHAIQNRLVDTRIKINSFWNRRDLVYIKQGNFEIRKWKFQIAMFRRELDYRTREQYRDFIRQWGAMHKIRNWAWMLIFADYLAEQGWRVMENRIRKIAENCRKYLADRAKLMEAVLSDGVPQLLEAAKDLGKKVAQDRNREIMKRFL